MALVRTNLIGSQSTTPIGTGSYTTGAAVTTAGAFLVVVCFGASGTAVSAANMTVTDSQGNVYTSRITVDSSWSANDGSIRVWTAPVTTAGSTTWTIDQGADSQDQYNVIVLQYTGADQSGLGVTANSTDLGGANPDGAKSITLSGAPLTTSEVVGVWGRSNSGAASAQSTPGATFTEIFDLDTNSHTGVEVEIRTGSASTTVDLADIDTAGVNNIFRAMAVAFEVKAGAGGTTGFDPRQAAMAWHPNSPIAFLRPNWSTGSPTVTGAAPQTVTSRRRMWWARARRQPQVPIQGSFCTWGTELAAWGAWQGPLNAQRTWEQILVCSGPPYVPPIIVPRRRRGWATLRHAQPGAPTQVTSVTVLVPMPVEAARRRYGATRRRQQPQVPPTQIVTVTASYVPPIPTRTPRRGSWIGRRQQPHVHDDRSGTFPPPAPQTIRQAIRRGFTARRRTQPVTPSVATVSVVVTYTPPIPSATRRRAWLPARRGQPGSPSQSVSVAVRIVPQIVEPKRRYGFVTRRRQQPHAPFSVVVVAPTYRPPISRPAKRFGWWRKPRPVITTLYSTPTPPVVVVAAGDLTVWLGKTGTTTTVLATTGHTEVALSKTGTVTTVCDTTGHVTVTLGTL